MRQTGPEEAPLILIIEDEPRIRRFLRLALEVQGCSVLEAGTAEAGVALAASRQPDVVLLDLGLPDCDGLDAARAIREQIRVPIVVISARAQEQSKSIAYAAGVDEYLVKPFNLDELNQVVLSIVRRRSGAPG